jgi:heme A synthase
MFMAHSGIRYLVLLFGVACAVYAIFGWATGRSYDRTMRVIASIFAGTLHLQILLGVVVIFTRGFYPALMGHILTMVIAATVAQLPVSVMRRRPEDQRTYAPHAVSALIALALIWAGVAAIGRSLLGSAA